MRPTSRTRATSSARPFTLSRDALGPAVAANPIWAKRLGWIRHIDAIGALTGAPPVAASPGFARAIVAWQRPRALAADGILGPITWGRMRGALAPAGSLTGVVPLAPPPPDGLDAIVKTFGDPRPLMADGSITPEHRLIWERQTLAQGVFPFPIPLVRNQPDKGVARTFHAHRLLVETFEAVFEEIARLGLHGEIHSFQGIYAFRPIRGVHDRLSLHAFGAAIDLNAETNALGADGDIDDRVVAVFRHFGFRWGGDFAGTRDPMHFQYATGY